jgi:hypothetical protein
VGEGEGGGGGGGEGERRKVRVGGLGNSTSFIFSSYSFLCGPFLLSLF